MGTPENQFSQVFNSEFSVLYCTQNRKFGVENHNQIPSFSNSELSILHDTQSEKLGVENLGVFSSAYQLTPRFSKSEFSILHHILKRKTRNFLQGLPEQRFFTKLCNLIKLRVFPTPRFRFCATVYPKQKTLRWKTLEFDQTALEKLPGLHLRAFRFQCSVKWKTRSWKTSGLIRGDENTSGKFTKVFISEFSVLGIVQNGKLGGEIRGSEISQNSDHAFILTLPLAIKIKP